MSMNETFENGSTANANALENQNKALRSKLRKNEVIDRNEVKGLTQHINHSISKEREYEAKAKASYAARYTNNDYYLYLALLEAQKNTTRLVESIQSRLESDFRMKY